MARACGLSFRFFYPRIPILPGAREYAAQGMVPGGAYCNRDHFGPAISISPKVPESERIILFDPQTSGGLLIALPQAAGETLLQRLKGKGIQEASLVGEVISPEKNLISVE
jgi:selenide,water dikinase